MTCLKAQPPDALGTKTAVPADLILSHFSLRANAPYKKPMKQKCITSDYCAKTAILNFWTTVASFPANQKSCINREMPLTSIRANQVKRRHFQNSFIRSNAETRARYQSNTLLFMGLITMLPIFPPI